MTDFYEIDFLDVETKKSGDAIPLRYQVGGTTRIHVVDGGFQETGDSIVAHINKYYGNPHRIDAVIVTHGDADHTGGLRKVLETYNIGELWMLRPWLYANELLGRFSRYTSVTNLVDRLKEAYSSLSALEELAISKGIPIKEPFQGAIIGHFTVMAPTKARYLDLVVESDKTPTPAAGATGSAAQNFAALIEQFARKAIAYVSAAWNVEHFPEEDTSAENNMCVVQYANLCGDRILLTADAGRAALAEAAAYAPFVGLPLPGINRIQIPHHGSRHNVSTAILDRLLGQRLALRPVSGQENIQAIVSAAKKDEDHPRKAVIRAFIHRGSIVVSTEDGDKRISRNAPGRNWQGVPGLPYPEDQEA